VNARADGAVVGAPKLILRLEGAALLLAAGYFYWRLDAPWILFAALFLAPDLSFLAYLISPRAGAIAYNAAHGLWGRLSYWCLASRSGQRLLDI
jgi:hypothetical protein